MSTTDTEDLTIMLAKVLRGAGLNISNTRETSVIVHYHGSDYEVEVRLAEPPFIDDML